MRKIQKNAIYKHFKGNYYIVIDFATDSETGESLVIYRSLYGDCSLWVRPYDSFISEIDKLKYPNIKQRYRFKKVRNQFISK